MRIRRSCSVSDFSWSGASTPLRIRSSTRWVTAGSRIRSDLAIGQSLRDVNEEPPLLFGQRLQLVRRFDAVTDSFEYPLGDRWIEHQIGSRDWSVPPRRE